VVLEGELFGNCACAGKTSCCCPLIVQPEGRALQRAPRTGLDRLVREALTRQIAGCLRAGPSPGAEPGRPDVLGARATRSPLRLPPRDAARLEVVADQRVRRATVASARARDRANLSSSTAPASVSRSIVSARAAGATLARSKRASSSADESRGFGACGQPVPWPSCRFNSRRTRRARSRSSSTPTSSPARRTTSAGSVRHDSPSRLTWTRPRGEA
jgi:hypothetical protein